MRKAQSQYAIVSLFFRVMLGIIYGIVFLSLYLQILELIGQNGILPVSEFVQTAHPSFFTFPTLFLLNSSDAFILILAFAGILFSFALAFGVYPRLSIIALFILYLSFVTAGRDFFSFQWDALLLEATFLAIFLPLKGNLFNFKKLREPSVFLVFLFRFLLFKLYIESGIAKLIYGADWLKLAAMQYYYETSPLPSIGGYMMQLLPAGIYMFTALLILAVELIVPFMFFWPRKARIWAFYILLVFNMLVFLTSNYGFFNLLCIVLSIFLLDDAHIIHLFKLKKTLHEKKFIRPNWMSHAIALCLILLILPFSAVEFWEFGTRQVLPESVHKIQRIYEPFHIINQYHLFPGVVRDRLVIEFSGTSDMKEWKKFRFRFTPQDGKDFPPFIPFYQARFAFQYSFITLDQFRSEYFVNTVKGLCNPKELGNLLSENPFPDEKPKALRIDVYKYTFSKPDELFAKGNWWHRQYVGTFRQAVPCG